MNIGCRYCGTYSDFSGYGQANRADITALFMTGINLTTERVVQVNERSNYGLQEQIAHAHNDRNIPYQFKIIHLTPDMYTRYKDEGKYNIGRLMWETDMLPKEWVGPCNQVNEIWTASERMVTMIKKSGVTVPVHAFPQPININLAEEHITPFQMRYNKDFIFYSIFQWIERKNPRTLLISYWKAFEGNNEVTLLLKTYRNNYSLEEFTRIKEDILRWKSELGFKQYPKVFLVKQLLKESEMYKLHKLGDVYVSGSSGEGWCRPVQEAMLFDKPVISADNGGITDYLSEDYYYRLPSQLQRVTEVSWIPWYTKDQNWWEIKEADLIKAFKDVYANKNSLKAKADKARDYVVSHCSYQAVGEQMVKRLQEIQKII